ncbi:MAG: class I SAM-dependent methyltransferase [Vicinamibacterales bacterium]
MHNAEFNDPRLVEVYDAESPWARDDDYFVALVDETPGARVLDVGCGTGRLALGLAAAGHAVTGIDPSLAALAAARTKAGSERVTWIHGTAESAPAGAFDVAVMTGHVPQFLLSEDEWTRALRALWRALVRGGRLAFHAYDPEARTWERWNPQDSRRQVAIRDGTTVLIWTEVTGLSDDTVSFSHYYRFPSGEELRSDSSLRFWSEPRLRESVTTAGFAIERVHGGWRGEPVGSGDGELIFVARR